MNNIFKDNLDKTSMMRFGFFYCLILSSLITLYIVYKDRITFESIALIGTWLSAGFGGKVFQSFAERNKIKKVNDDFGNN